MLESAVVIVYIVSCVVTDAKLPQGRGILAKSQLKIGGIRCLIRGKKKCTKLSRAIF